LSSRGGGGGQHEGERKRGGQFKTGKRAGGNWDIIEGQIPYDSYLRRLKIKRFTHNLNWGGKSSDGEKRTSTDTTGGGEVSLKAGLKRCVKSGPLIIIAEV